MSVLVLYHGPTELDERLSAFPDFDQMFEDIDRADRELNGGRRVYMLPSDRHIGPPRTVKVYAAFVKHSHGERQ